MARYANDTVCHVWASGKLASGQSNNGQLYFEGRVLYSYGRHYAVGVIMPDNVVLLNSSKSSVTTARHCSYATRATSHMVRYYVPELEDIASALEAVAIGQVDDWQESAIARHARKHALAMTSDTLAYLMQCAGLSPSKAATKAAKAASRATLSQSIARLRAVWPNYERGQFETWELSRIAEWAEYIADNGKGLRDTGKVAMRAIASNARQIAADKQAAIAAERFEREREAREAWLNGASGYWRGTDSQGGAMLRATGLERDESGTITGGTLETSQGASVPLIHAIRIFQIARACREAGRGVEPRARVGFYTVDRIDETGGFNAGCHRINWPEIERLATLLGLYP